MTGTEIHWHYVLYWAAWLHAEVFRGYPSLCSGVIDLPGNTQRTIRCAALGSEKSKTRQDPFLYLSLWPMKQFSCKYS